MASTHVNHNIYITEVKTGKCLHSLVGHRRTPWCVTFHPTIPGLVASGCLDGEVRIWDLHVSTSTSEVLHGALVPCEIRHNGPQARITRTNRFVYGSIHKSHLKN